MLTRAYFATRSTLVLFAFMYDEHEKMYDITFQTETYEEKKTNGQSDQEGA